MDFVQCSDPGPEQQMLNREAVLLLEQAVDSLPAIYRCVFVLREIENMTTAETAACLDLSQENVKIRLARARQVLRKELYARAGATSARSSPWASAAIAWCAMFSAGWGGTTPLAVYSCNAPG